MKYIVLETAEGAKYPILFPDALTHCFVAGAMQLVVDTLDPRKDLRPQQLDRLLREGSANVSSAGFVAVGTDVNCHGESESLGGLKSAPADAGRIILGDPVAFMPDAFVTMTAQRLLDVPLKSD